VTVTRHLYKRASRIIAVSRGVERDLLDCLGLPEELVTAIPNPVVDRDLQALAEHPIEHPWFQDDHPVLLAVGRLVPQKDYPILLQAFRAVRDKRIVRLIILGEGELRGELETLAKVLKIEKDVDFRGFVKNPFPFMRNCTVYILCSRFEGLPGALIQAMACGAPSISTDCPSGPSEIIDSGSNGLLIPVGDVRALTRSIELLLDDQERRRSFSEAGRKTTSAFSVSSMIRMYEEELLDRSLRDSAASHEAKAAL
jgi:glycosyltransferase involved in cell wall biosynthesis